MVASGYSSDFYTLQLGANMATLRFFATPEEQYEWLKHYFQPEVMWCVVRDKTRDPYRWWTVQSPEELTLFAHHAPHSLAVCVVLGWYDLGEPRWRRVSLDTGGEYEDIDFFSSHGIEIYLSLYSFEDQHLLFEGWMAVGRPSDYQSLGYNPEQLYRRFRQLERQWRKLMDCSYTPVYRGIAVMRAVPVPYSAGVSYGAVQWCLSGGRLKSALTYAVYDVVPIHQAKQYERALRQFQCPEGTQRCRRCKGGGEIVLEGKVQRCAACDGRGCASISTKWCPHCEGSGSVLVPLYSDRLMVQDCPFCGGRGIIA